MRPPADSGAAWTETAPATRSPSFAAVESLAACLTPLVAHIPERYRTAVELTDLRGSRDAEATRCPCAGAQWPNLPDTGGDAEAPGQQSSGGVAADGGRATAL